MSYRVNIEGSKKLSDDAENNTAVATVDSNGVLRGALKIQVLELSLIHI